MSLHWHGLGGRGSLSRSHLFLDGVLGYIAVGIAVVGALLVWLFEQLLPWLSRSAA